VDLLLNDIWKMDLPCPKHSLPFQPLPCFPIIKIYLIIPIRSWCFHKVSSKTRSIRKSILFSLHWKLYHLCSHIFLRLSLPSLSLLLAWKQLLNQMLSFNFFWRHMRSPERLGPPSFVPYYLQLPPSNRFSRSWHGFHIRQSPCSRSFVVSRG